MPVAPDRGGPRTIIHVDMDAFYASVEQRDRPELAGRPVVVGADPRGRGVVSAASYEARRFGVHSAMPIGRAARLCPHAAFLPVDMVKYAQVSRRIMEVLAEFTPLMEAISIDEAFLDVSASRALMGDGPTIAARIKARIREAVGARGLRRRRLEQVRRQGRLRPREARRARGRGAGRGGGLSRAPADRAALGRGQGHGRRARVHRRTHHRPARRHPGGASAGALRRQRYRAPGARPRTR